MIDPFGRSITYLRVSVTDRCDFRCVYCMSEDMTFLPKAELLTLEEMDRVCSAFVRLGVRKLHAVLKKRFERDRKERVRIGAMLRVPADLSDPARLGVRLQRAAVQFGDPFENRRSRHPRELRQPTHTASPFLEGALSHIHARL